MSTHPYGDVQYGVRDELDTAEFIPEFRIRKMYNFRERRGRGEKKLPEKTPTLQRLLRSQIGDTSNNTILWLAPRNLRARVRVRNIIRVANTLNTNSIITDTSTVRRRYYGVRRGLWILLRRTVFYNNTSNRHKRPAQRRDGGVAHRGRARVIILLTEGFVVVADPTKSHCVVVSR